ARRRRQQAPGCGHPLVDRGRSRHDGEDRRRAETGDEGLFAVEGRRRQPRRVPVDAQKVVLRITGAVLTTASAVLFLIVFFADLFGLHANPYLGVLFFIVLPALFVLGLVLFAIGNWPQSWPRVDLNDPIHRRAFVIV